MTVNNALVAIRSLGLSATHAHKEYRITLKGISRERAEAIAYYTNDTADAIATAAHIARHNAISTDLNLAHTTE